MLDEWVAALRLGGIREIDGRIVGNDQAFDDDGLGAGWSWDYLQYHYAAPVGALEYNEDVAAMRVAPAAATGLPAAVTLEAGSGLTMINRAVTGAAGSEIDRGLPPAARSTASSRCSGSVPLGGPIVVRPVAVVNPTAFFVQSLKDGFIMRGIAVSGAAVDFDDIAAESAGQ